MWHLDTTDNLNFALKGCVPLDDYNNGPIDSYKSAPVKLKINA